MATPQWVLDELAARRERAEAVYELELDPSMMNLFTREAYIERFMDTMPPITWTEGGTQGTQS
jgi:hypothetical protein